MCAKHALTGGLGGKFLLTYKGLSYVHGWSLGKVHKKDPYREEPVCFALHADSYSCCISQVMHVNHFCTTICGLCISVPHQLLGYSLLGLLLKYDQSLISQWGWFGIVVQRLYVQVGAIILSMLGSKMLISPDSG